MNSFCMELRTAKRRQTGQLLFLTRCSASHPPEPQAARCYPVQNKNNASAEGPSELKDAQQTVLYRLGQPDTGFHLDPVPPLATREGLGNRPWAFHGNRGPPEKQITAVLFSDLASPRESQRVLGPHSPSGSDSLRCPSAEQGTRGYTDPDCTTSGSAPGPYGGAPPKVSKSTACRQGGPVRGPGERGIVECHEQDTAKWETGGQMNTSIRTHYKCP